jgi:very-short-patch-repair endonuclease
MRNLDADQTRRGALQAWQKKVQQIGKGTGKHAETYRRDARKYMQQCRDAIPAWIMPLHRVAEQIEMEPEVFDVVIVDEASQTGATGLILQYLGKQCIIVGDDKQISPEAGFVEAGQVRDLIHQHLGDVPFAETLDLSTSLFDQAAIRYGGRITLREHFRCMPEIIRFSNELCYSETPLIPLRQYPPMRLPPLAVRFVTDGYREGSAEHAINRPEAAAVVKTVIDCLSDPRYAEKSFGVICLQGRAQAQLIESMILDKVGAEPFKDAKRRLLCGDPYTFQGDERDIVFLSMVASVEGEGRSAPLLRKAFEQRFNVAASRARDQMWLFHSIRESELHPDCMRRRLLSFFYNRQADALDCDVDQYKSNVFERDVADDLKSAGFRVISQFQVAGRWIDLVVEGGNRRVAVECDGDEWHGPDRYDADMARQRTLERCGWTFLRIRGSVYYANRSKAARGLVEALATLGLAPTPAVPTGSTAPDWVAEISGNECMDALGRYTVDGAEDNVTRQRAAADGSEGDHESAVIAAAEGAADRGIPAASETRNDGDPIRKDADTRPAAPEMAVAETDLAAVVTCLHNSSEPLRRPQIIWRAKIEEAKWDQIISELLRRGTVVPSGSAYTLSGASAPVTAVIDESAEIIGDVAEVAAIESTVWFEIAHWAKKNECLERWQRGLAYSLGVRKRQGALPSPKQAKQGKKILLHASILGFNRLETARPLLDGI